jgi:hypothetical protein
VQGPLVTCHISPGWSTVDVVVDMIVVVSVLLVGAGVGAGVGARVGAGELQSDEHLPQLS